MADNFKAPPLTDLRTFAPSTYPGGIYLFFPNAVSQAATQQKQYSYTLYNTSAYQNGMPPVHP